MRWKKSSLVLPTLCWKLTDTGGNIALCRYYKKIPLPLPPSLPLPLPMCRYYKKSYATSSDLPDGSA